jgi:type IV secretory pathway VirB10-like protein
MASLSDTLTAVGVVLVLVFGSIALYLYTRVQQTDQKVSLLESIVLDLKLTNEIPMFHEPPSAPAPSLPAAPAAPASPRPIEDAEYKPFEPEEEQGQQGQQEQEPHAPLESLESQESQESQQQGQQQGQQPEQQDYEAMSAKELQSLARARGLSLEKGAKKPQLIELLKQADSGIKPSPLPSSLSLEILDA